MAEQEGSSGRFDVQALAATLPDKANTMLADHYMTARPSSSARVFRVYRPVPAHFHRECDEYLYVLSGRGTFWMGEPSNEAPFAPGQFIVFDRSTVHCIPQLHEHPVLFLAIDTPRRRPDDITFVDPADGDATNFMARNADAHETG
jgi:mannose-6-phosphate isomerase-like protein (cupin superfamily)